MFAGAAREQHRAVIPQPRSLLIADDSPEMRYLLRRLCAHAFTDIHECGDGVEAVAMFAARQPDAVLMDIAMPRQDGLAATARIRAHSPTARVIIVSQHDDASFRQAAAQAGATAFVSKLDLQPLRQLLGLQHGATQAPSSDEPQPPIPGAPSPPTKL
jgi:CheY-like chemotaxis protein